MKSHLDHLKDSFPDLLKRPVLDLGSGKGSFLIDVAQHGGSAVGVEISPAYIEETKKRADKAGVVVKVLAGKGEQIPFADASFGFVNMCEVIEHVIDPTKTLKEVYRVLQIGGEVYMSVPNRFGFKDQHFGLFFINWIPRKFSRTVISWFNIGGKDYSGSIGYQHLDEMHYYTFKAITSLARSVGFKTSDIRIEKIYKRFPHAVTRRVVLFSYLFLRMFYFNSFHVRLTK